MDGYLEPYVPWIESTWEKTERKLKLVRERSADKIPYTAVDGVHDDWKEKRIGRWTNGFWAGIMWLMYLQTGEERYRQIAQDNEEWLDRALYDAENLNHDVGFLWLLTAGADYRLTGNTASKNRILTAASALASRFNIEKRFIRAWNDEEKKTYSIIDCMMNLPLLYLASDITQDNRFRLIACAHADSAMQNHIREDGSIYHVVSYEENGVVIPKKTQGYDSKTSSWSRGQSWAVYGFVLSYLHTGNEKYLAAAKRAAHYFLSNLLEDPVPLCDFRAPAAPIYHDTSAGACAACGMLEIAKCVPEYEKKLYISGALRLLCAIEKDYIDWNPDSDVLLKNGCEAYHDGLQDLPLIYGDYYFIEALYKLRGGKELVW